MRKTRVLFTALALTAALLLMGGGAAFASADPSSPEAPMADLQVTGYTVTRPDGSVNTGSILKGELVTVTVNILDNRVASGSATPTAALNTASFSLRSASDITQPGTVSAGADGLAYSIRFNSAVYTGIGASFAFTVSYPDARLAVAAKEILLNQAVPVPVPDAKAPETVVKGTGFVLKDARYGNDAIYAGKPFTLSAVVMATNGAAAVENVTITFVPPEALTLNEGSSIVYIGTMAPGASMPVNATFLPSANIQEGSYSIRVDVNGTNQNTGEPVSAQMTISVPVFQPERFEIFKAQLPTDLATGTEGSMGYGSVTLVNRGKVVVSNVSVEIIGDGLTADEGRQYVGNVAAGEQKSADFNLHADTPGTVDALVVVSYENVRGEQKTLEQAFTVNVAEAAPQDAADPNMPPEDTGEGAGHTPPLWLWIAIAAAAAIAVAAIVAKRRKKRLAAAEAALDYTLADDED
ncbi:MAG: hypothetical protein LBS91_02075 [Clostridiales Family XIII bacterium]|jgi:hypothetical protein|nr:hypothetical protein [Clostridiales Family XIII bacterium]